MDRGPGGLKVEPAPEVHGGGSVLVLGHVVQVAVVERGQDEVELLVRGFPGGEPVSLPDHLQDAGVYPVQLLVLVLEPDVINQQSVSVLFKLVN